jgi:hypothetical protein
LFRSATAGQDSQSWEPWLFHLFRGRLPVKRISRCSGLGSGNHAPQLLGCFRMSSYAAVAPDASAGAGTREKKGEWCSNTPDPGLANAPSKRMEKLTNSSAINSRSNCKFSSGQKLTPGNGRFWRKADIPKRDLEHGYEDVDPFAAGHAARCGIGQSSLQSSLTVRGRPSKKYVMEDPCHRSSSPRAAAPPP